MSKALGLKSFKAMLTRIDTYVNCIILKNKKTYEYERNQITLVKVL